MSYESKSEYRSSYLDKRVHAVLYFIEPNVNGLKDLDVKCLKELSDKVNLIPVIAKSDTLTAEEKSKLKTLVFLF